jgi:hypothetical protein
VRLARAAYEEVLRGEDPDGMKTLKAELDDAEAVVTRLKRSRESGPPSHLL